MKFEDDQYLYVCESIERELCQEYENNLSLTDHRCLYALDRSKVAVKQAFGFAKNEAVSLDSELNEIASRLVALAQSLVNESSGPTLRDFNARIDKIARSVRRHSHDGERAYYTFVKNYLR